MKIALIDPGSKRLLLNEHFPHIGLAYVAAVLQAHGHQVTCLDVALAGHAATERFLHERHDLVGLSVTSFSFSAALEIASRIRTINPEAVLVLGGPHVPIAMENTIESCDVDYAVYGEGEYTLLELVDVLQTERRPGAKRLSEIQGLIFRDGDRIVSNPARPRIAELERLPYPAYDLFQMDEYATYPLLTSRGCPFGCSFCAVKAIWGTTWRARRPQHVVEEIAYARERFAWDGKPFNIIDDSFNADHGHVTDFCDQVLDSGMNIQWFSSGFRADRVSSAMAAKMKASGCIGVSVGIESASDRVLKRVKKRETISEIASGCRELAQAGIPVQAQFMIGNPGDTPETVRDSLKFANRHRFASVAFYLALPYPRTELWDYVKEHGTFLREDYTQYHHFSDEPVFETPEFPAEARVKAYRIGRRMELRTKIRQELRTKASRVGRLDFHDLSLKRVSKAVARLSKYALDLCLRRGQQA